MIFHDGNSKKKMWSFHQLVLLRTDKAECWIEHHSVVASLDDAVAAVREIAHRGKALVLVERHAGLGRRRTFIELCSE